MFSFIILVSKSMILRNDKAYFNVILRDFGVKGVKVQELVSLDEHLLACLP